MQHAALLFRMGFRGRMASSLVAPSRVGPEMRSRNCLRFSSLILAFVCQSRGLLQARARKSRSRTGLCVTACLICLVYRLRLSFRFPILATHGSRAVLHRQKPRTLRRVSPQGLAATGRSNSSWYNLRRQVCEWQRGSRAESAIPVVQRHARPSETTGSFAQT